MDLENIKVEGGRRCGAEDLTKMLEQLPVELSGNKSLLLEAFMGLGRIVYLHPRHGTVKEVYFKSRDVTVDNSRNNYPDRLFFQYENQLYSLRWD